MELTNLSDQSLTLGTDRLPWLGTGLLSMVAVEADDVSRLLPQLAPFLEQFDTSEVALAPGASARGTLFLLRHFPSVAEVLKTKKVLLFWSYWLRTKEHPEAACRLFGGAVLGS
jgi:hypothetical protein